MPFVTRSASLLLVAALLAGCQTQSTPSGAGYGPVETWPSYRASRSNRGGD